MISSLALVKESRSELITYSSKSLGLDRNTYFLTTADFLAFFAPLGENPLIAWGENTKAYHARIGIRQG
jgi:hypothetical protein